MNFGALEIRRIDPRLESPLTEFFRRLKEVGDDRGFHPHPFDREMAHRIAQDTGQDLYYAVVEGERILGYGMLRGWDAGYEIPSLGIAIRSEAKGVGLGKLLMHFLHAAARQRGATRVRLKVHPDNTVAVRLYQELGYVFQGEESGQLVGIIDL